MTIDCSAWIQQSARTRQPPSRSPPFARETVGRSLQNSSGHFGWCVAFPLTLALSRRERELASRVFLRSDIAPTGTVRFVIQRRDDRTTQRLRFAPARWAILP